MGTVLTFSPMFSSPMQAYVRVVAKVMDTSIMKPEWNEP